jgi:hypothetical protein
VLLDVLELHADLQGRCSGVKHKNKFK